MTQAKTQQSDRVKKTVNKIKEMLLPEKTAGYDKIKLNLEKLEDV